MQLKGNLPIAQVRDLDVQKRETDLVLGTFGRSFYVLDDYSALRGVSAQSMAQEAQLFPLRNTYQFSMRSQIRPVESDWTAPNPPMAQILCAITKFPPAHRLTLFEGILIHRSYLQIGTHFALCVNHGFTRRPDLPFSHGVGRNKQMLQLP